MRRAGILALAAAATLGFAAPAHAGWPPSTTSRTITGDVASPFSFLGYGPGWKRVVRDDLAEPQRRRSKRRRSLLYFTQMSDFQLADEESPARVELADLSDTPFTAAWRPQEALVPQIVDQAIRSVNAMRRSSLRDRKRRRARMALAITTGDSADNQQRNEVQWVVRLLEGGPLTPNSGVDGTCGSPAGEGGRYTGVQDSDDMTDRKGYYDPDVPAGAYGAWPRWPGLLDRAQQTFTTEGLKVPSYVSFGNHDGLAQGNQSANAAFETLATGCAKLALGDAALVPSDAGRQYVDHPQYRALHATGHQADAHGFGYVDQAELDASASHASYYAFSPKRGLRFISIDTVSEGGLAGPSAEGNIDDPQFRWLTATIGAAEKRGELVVVFGHHPIRSLNAGVPDELAGPCLFEGAYGHGVNPGCDRDPRSSGPYHLGPDLQALLLAHRNVIAFVAGHTHVHKITPFPRPGGGGFWGIETASEVDWPIQSRLLEIFDNRDGTLSIYGTVIDHSGPVVAPPSGTDAAALDPATLAAAGRTLAFNDPQGGGESDTATPEDRNVELLLVDPRAR